MDTDDIIGLAVFLGLVLIAAAAIAVFRETRRGGPRHRQPRTDTAHVPRQREQPEHQDSGHRPPAPSLRTLTESERAYYENEWARAQERFVDDPAAAVATADRLLAQAMADRGYPVDQPVAPAATVDEYQRVHQAAERGRTGAATTEELGDAMARYRELFAEVLGHVSPGERVFGKHAAPEYADAVAHPVTANTGRHRRR